MSGRWIAGLGIGGLLGALATLVLQPTTPPPDADATHYEGPSPDTAEVTHDKSLSRGTSERLAAQLAALRDTLDAEVAARRALEAEVRELRRDLANASRAPAAVPPAPEPPAPAGTPPSVAWFDGDKLRDQDLSDAVVGQIEALYGKSQLEALYLRDRASREGWLDSPRYREERAALEQALKQRLGARDYDALLYATGRPNRVVLQSVLADSPGALAGLESGDLILRYAGREIFQPRDLVEATRGGRAGETVEIAVLRGGRELHVYAPRGPLGTRVRAESQAPDLR